MVFAGQRFENALARPQLGETRHCVQLGVARSEDKRAVAEGCDARHPLFQLGAAVGQGKRFVGDDGGVEDGEFDAFARRQGHHVGGGMVYLREVNAFCPSAVGMYGFGGRRQRPVRRLLRSDSDKLDGKAQVGGREEAADNPRFAVGFAFDRQDAVKAKDLGVFADGRSVSKQPHALVLSEREAVGGVRVVGDCPQRGKKALLRKRQTAVLLHAVGNDAVAAEAAHFDVVRVRFAVRDAPDQRVVLYAPKRFCHTSVSFP